MPVIRMLHSIIFEMRMQFSLLLITIMHLPRADREFLIQLGRVKDAFELDKMFFIVNAIDLAANDEEEALVQSFVGNELQKFGIRNPRVHGISSLQALQAKTEKQSNEMMDFI